MVTPTWLPSAASRYAAVRVNKQRLVFVLTHSRQITYVYAHTTTPQNAYCIAVSKALAGVAGTSASCPVVAGVFGKLNELRLAAGKPPMGFLNPFIYQNPTGFNDVTQGNNHGAGLHGFEAIKGWDPATGMGTPNYEALSKLV